MSPIMQQRMKKEKGGKEGESAKCASTKGRLPIIDHSPLVSVFHALDVVQSAEESWLLGRPLAS